MVSKSKKSELLFGFDNEFDNDSLNLQIKRKSEEIEQYINVLREVSRSISMMDNNIAGKQI